MKEKKYIDRLYQEKFRDFEAAPRDAVWESIEAKLQEKKRKRAAIPLWYRYAGVAAIFAFLLMLGDWIMPIQPSATVATEDTEETTTSPNSSPIVSPEILNSSDEAVASEEAEETIIRQGNSSVISPGISSPSEETGLIVNNTGRPSSEDSNSVIALNTPKEQRTTEDAASNLSSKNAISETPALVTGIPLEKEETAPVREELKPSIFDALKTSEEAEVATTESKSNFEVSTHATPIYYGKMGSANPLDTGFDNNRQSELTYSYGVNLALNISNRIKIRSGVSRVNLSYSTSGIGYQAVAGVYPVRNASLVKIPDPDVKMVTGEVNGRTRSSTNRTPAGIFTQGNLNQKMGYIEVPVEFEINLLQSKFELNFIGGGSTLFLEENEVVLNTGSISAAGKAENLNEVSFSANVGLGLDYNLSEKFRLNLEPMLKYQLKTFDTPTGDVQPYFFGVYTGFSYRF